MDLSLLFLYDHRQNSSIHKRVDKISPGLLNFLATMSEYTIRQLCSPTSFLSFNHFLFMSFVHLWSETTFFLGEDYINWWRCLFHNGDHCSSLFTICIECLFSLKYTDLICTKHKDWDLNTTKHTNINTSLTWKKEVKKKLTSFTHF